MNPAPPLAPEQLDALRALDACAVASAIETFHARIRNRGFARDYVRCRFPQLAPMAGYAATVTIQGSGPPTGTAPFVERTDWWDYVLSVPAPRVLVVRDASTEVGRGSLLGAVQVNLLRALGCVGAVTNGSARELPAAAQLGFQLFTGGITLSHTYVRIVEFGAPVDIAGLEVHSGDLLHGDQHGVQTVPLDLAPQIPVVAARLRRNDAELISLCQSPDFSPAELRQTIARQRA